MTKTFISKEVAQRGAAYLNDAQSIIDYMLNHPVLGKCFVMPDPPPPPLPQELYGDELCVIRSEEEEVLDA